MPVIPTRRPRGNTMIMILTLIAVVAVVAIAVGAMSRGGGAGSDSPDASSIWKHDLDSGLADAAATGRPMYVLYTADWCPPCKKFKRNILSDAEIATYLESNFALVKIDLTERGGPNSEIANLNGVRGVPTMMAYDSSGVLIDTLEGAPGSPEFFLDWLYRCRR